MHKPFLRVASIIFFIIIPGGCSTLRTTSHYTLGSPKFYSGTRMDIDTINESEDYVLKKYNVKGPENPKLDFPFSFIFDTIILPVVIPIALSDAIFE